jgi:hypothetical protein
MRKKLLNSKSPGGRFTGKGIGWCPVLNKRGDVSPLQFFPRQRIAEAVMTVSEQDTSASSDKQF